MDILLMFLSEKMVKGFLKKQKKNLFRKKQNLLQNMKDFLHFQKFTERMLMHSMKLSNKSYIAKMSKMVNTLMQTIIDDFQKSDEIYPQIMFHRRLLDIISKINDMQKGQQVFVNDLLTTNNNNTTNNNKKKKQHHHEEKKFTLSSSSSSSSNSSIRGEEEDDFNFHEKPPHHTTADVVV